VRAPWPRIGYWPALLPSALVPHRAVLADGTEREAPVSSSTAEPEPEPVPPVAGTSVPSGGPRGMLGTVAHARAGDKGGNSNVGIWVPDPAHWEWLRHTVTTERVREWVPDCEVVRHELPRLRLVHLVLKGLLGTGGASNLRVDQLGKSVGEFLRSKHVALP